MATSFTWMPTTCVLWIARSVVLCLALHAGLKALCWLPLPFHGGFIRVTVIRDEQLGASQVESRSIFCTDLLQHFPHAIQIG